MSAQDAATARHLNPLWSDQEKALSMSKLDLTSKRTWGALAVIALTAGALTTAFAWTEGWIGTRLTSAQLFAETPQPFPPGFRRAHGKGICIAGTFRPSGAAVPLSTARVFTQPGVPIVGRLAIAMGDPHGSRAFPSWAGLPLPWVIRMGRTALPTWSAWRCC